MHVADRSRSYLQWHGNENPILTAVLSQNGVFAVEAGLPLVFKESMIGIGSMIDCEITNLIFPTLQKHSG